MDDGTAVLMMEVYFYLFISHNMHDWKAPKKVTYTYAEPSNIKKHLYKYERIVGLAVDTENSYHYTYIIIWQKGTLCKNGRKVAKHMIELEKIIIDKRYSIYLGEIVWTIVNR